MYLHLSKTARCFTPSSADELAARLNSDAGDGWSYQVIHDPLGTGFSLVAIFDEDGEFVSYFE